MTDKKKQDTTECLFFNPYLSMNYLIKKSTLLLFFSCICFLSSYANNHISERRVYYLDATYSMVTPSKLWNPVRNDLAKAIHAIEDEDTEIYVVVFGGNGGAELKTWHGYATESDKKKIIDGFQSFVPQKNTMTYLDRPLNDFYSNKIASDKITYCFLMTDGKDENASEIFHNSLKKWDSQCGRSNVYGFYVMLNNQAKDKTVEAIIDSQEHLWKVESADVNINLLRLNDRVMFNVRSDDHIEIPISGNTKELSFKASFPDGSGLKAKECKIEDGKLKISVNTIGKILDMPELFSQDISITLCNGGNFDFLLTDKIIVECSNKRERILRTSANKQDFGIVKQYDSFLFVPSKIEPARKIIKFEFNEDAQKDPNTYAEFKFVDKKGLDVNLEDIHIKINGTKLQKNSFKVTPKEPEANIEISFASGAKRGKHKGYLKLEQNNLQRINNESCNGDCIYACTWSVSNNKSMNPLAKALLWFGILVVSMLFLWFFIIKPVRYPRFKKFRKMVLVKKNGVVVSQFTVNFKGARRVVFATKVAKQNALNKLFTGQIKTIVNPFFEEPLTFIPSKKKKAIVRGKGYIFNPNPILQSGTAVITEPAQKLTINLQ